MAQKSENSAFKPNLGHNGSPDFYQYGHAAIPLKRIITEIEKLKDDPFPKDVKRIVNRNEKIFRVRVGDYRIQFIVLYERNLLFITDIDKRSKAYD